MTEKLLINDFIKDINVGAIVSTSGHVTRKMLDKIDFENANMIVEYGPGKGVITKQLLSKMSEDTVLFVFEINEYFIKELSKINDKRLIIVNSDAEKAQMILKNRYKIENVDNIISSIPFTFINKRKRRRIIFRSFTLLNEKGKFITYQYSLLIYNLIKKQFSEMSLNFTLINIPPVFIFECIKQKDEVFLLNTDHKTIIV